MLATTGIAALLILYAIWVIRRRIREIRAGKFCSCGCESCTGSCSGTDKKQKQSKTDSN